MTADFAAVETRHTMRSEFDPGHAPAYDIDFGALTIPYPPGVDISVVMRGLSADTIAIRTGAGQVALNLYAATADGALPGYTGSCLRYFASENIAATELECTSATEIAGTTADGMHIRFVCASGPHWFVRASIRSHIDHAAIHAEFARCILDESTVRIPRHHYLGAVVELSTNPTWRPSTRHL